MANFEFYEQEKHGFIISDFLGYFKIVLWCGIFLIVLGIPVIILGVSGIELEGEAAPSWFWTVGLGVTVLGGLIVLLYRRLVRPARIFKNLDHRRLKVTTATIIGGNDLPSTMAILDSGLNTAFGSNKGIAIVYEFVNENGDKKKVAKRIKLDDLHSVFPEIDARKYANLSRLVKGREVRVVIGPNDESFLLEDESLIEAEDPIWGEDGLVKMLVPQPQQPQSPEAAPES